MKTNLLTIRALAICVFTFVLFGYGQVSAQIITTICGTGTLPSGGAPDTITIATAARMNPQCIASDNAGNIYLTEGYYNRIRKITVSGIISEIAGTGSSGFSGDGGAATAAQINNVQGIAVDGSGNVYICDGNNSRIRKISNSGIITTIAGTGFSGSSGDGGAATAAGIGHVNSIAADPSGNVYFFDWGNYKIRKISTSGTITSIAGTGLLGYSGDGGPATAAALDASTTLAIDVYNNIYLADGNNHCIRKINTAGIINTIAGTGTSGYSGDGGAATAAMLRAPYAVAVDGAGNVYIADFGDSRIRKINTSGIISTYAGTGTNGYNGDNIAATSAQIGAPGAVAVDGNHNVYSGSTIDYRIRKITCAPVVAPIVGVSSVCAGASTTLTDSTTGGTWGTSMGPIASVSSTGVVTTGTMVTGGVTLSYTVSNSCGSTTVTLPFATIASPFIASVSGASTVCAGATISLTDATTGGTWTSSTPTVATVNASGVVTGVAAGTATISYSVSNSCFTGFSGKVITVNASTAAISGASSVCTGAATTLADATTGGTWTSSASTIATVSSTGVVTGIAAGSATISYSATVGSCTATVSKAMTVNAISPVAAISGTSAICGGSTNIFTDSTTGGTWTSSASTIATVSSTGIVTGLAPGSATISYTVSGACGTATATKTVTVSTAVAGGIISGASFVCAGAATTLTNIASGGTWSSSASTIASVNSSTGVVTGVAGGSATISYTATGGCNTAYATKPITVNPLPVVAAISGSSTVCVGAHITLGEVTSGGTWTSSPTTIATVSGNIVTGVAAGSVTLSYSVLGCGSTTVTKALTISPAPTIGATTGTSSITAGSSTTLTNTSGSGWTSSIPTVATVSATGVVLGVSSGTTTISCNSSNACGTVYATFAMTVSAAAAGSTYVISTAAGTGASGFSGDGGTATSAQLSYPYAVAVDASGNRYIADQVNNRIRKISATGTITTIAGTGVAGYSGDGGAATAAKLNLPTGVTVDASGNVYITDHSNNRIRKINTSGIISTVAGSGTGLDGAAATAASLYNPTSVSVDASGNMYITETGNHCVRKVNTSGIISRFAGSGSVGYTGDGAAATAAALSSPVGIYCDASGNVYISDLGNHSVRKVTSTGTITTVAGTGTAGYSNDGGAATSARINNPYNITMDGAGNMYICDYGNYAIRKVTSAGIISTIAGNGTIGYSGDGGAATLATMNAPTGIAVDASGNIYIADINNHRLRKLAIGCPLPLPGTLSGPTAVAIGGNIALFTTGTGGIWSSTNTARATVSSAGLAHGVATGVDTIKYTVTNSCGSASAIYVINVTASKESATETLPSSVTTNLKAYPNPSTGILTIETEQGIDMNNVLVFDITGKMVLQQAGSANTTQINMSDFTAGMYIFKVQCSNGELKQIKAIKE